VTVRFQHGDEHDVDVVGQIVAPLEADVADQHQHGVLAIDLAGMDSGLDQEHRLRRLKRRPVLGQDGSYEFTALRSRSNRLDTE